MQVLSRNPFYLLSQWLPQAETFVKEHKGDHAVVVLQTDTSRLLLKKQLETGIRAGEAGKKKKKRGSQSRPVQKVSTISIKHSLEEAKKTVRLSEQSRACLKTSDQESLKLADDLDATLTAKKLTELASPLLSSYAGIIEILHAETDQFKLGPDDPFTRQRRLIKSFNQHIRNLFHWKEGESSVEEQQQKARDRILFLEEDFPEYLQFTPSQGKKHQKSNHDLDVAQEIPKVMDCFLSEIESFKGIHWGIFNPQEPSPSVEQPRQLMKWVEQELSKAEMKNSRVAPDTRTVNDSLFKLNQYLNRLIDENHISELSTNDRRSIVQIHDQIGQKIKENHDYKDFRLSLAKVTPAIEKLRTVNEMQGNNSLCPAQKPETSSVEGNPARSDTAIAPAVNSEDSLTLQGASGFTPEPCIPAERLRNTDSNISTTVKGLLKEAEQAFKEDQRCDKKRISVSARLSDAADKINKLKDKITIETINELMGNIQTATKAEPYINTAVIPLINALNDSYALHLMSSTSLQEN